MSEPDGHSPQHHSRSIGAQAASWAAAACVAFLIGLIAGAFVQTETIGEELRAGTAIEHGDTGPSDAVEVIETLPDGMSAITRDERGLIVPGYRAGSPEQAGTGEKSPGGVRGGGGHEGGGGGHASPAIPLWLCVPFAGLLLSIALMPFAMPRFWHRHYPEVSLALGAFVCGVYVSAFGGAAHHGYAGHAILHAGLEYYSFIALIGGLFVVSGGILVEVNARGRPLANTVLLGVGAVLANVVGTTGASMLLIRPFMRMNGGRLRAIHVVFFIFIVSNCGGCLTPIGDPPLYLGFLKGVPFGWTLTHLWKEWALVVGCLLGLFFVTDVVIARRDARAGAAAAASEGAVGEPGAGVNQTEGKGSMKERPAVVRVGGAYGLACLVLMIGGVFIDPVLKKLTGLEGVPVGATFQLMVAAASLRLAPKSILVANGFNFHPVREVGLLFAGIFATMMPALGYLAQHAAGLGLESATQYYFATGALSAVLDNAPTYLNFLQTACSVLGVEMSPAGLRTMLDASFTIDHALGEDVRVTGVQMLSAISTGAVFFGACTYIGNGPNFMVKAIAETPGELRVRMPGFFGYVGLAAVYLVPVLVLNWLVFIR